MRNIALLVLVPIFFASCSASQIRTGFSVASYNMYLFYDGYESGTELSPFTGKDGYSENAYKARVRSTASYLMKHLGSYDVIVFQEIENSRVLKDLLEAGLRRCGFRYYGAAAEYGLLGIGYVSKYPAVSSNVHKSGESRNILELVFSLDGEEIALFTLHAPSRLNEDGESERYEMFSLLKSLLSMNRDKLRIAIGDFNADVREGESGIASDDSILSLSSAIVATKDTVFDEGVYFSPMLVSGELSEDGSYFYNGKWTFLDCVLLSKEAFDSRGLEYRESDVIAPAESRSSSGYPKRFDVKSMSGYSDHFAISVSLRYN